VSAFALKREDKKFRRALRKKAKGSRTYRHRIPKRYKVYIKSIYWTRRKNRYYQKYGRRCAVCRGTEYVDLHHKKYANYGNERDEDLVPLCRNHHGAFHAQHGVSRDMTEDTAAFIHGAVFDEQAANVLRNI